MSARHYVSLERRGFRRHHVVRSDFVRGKRRGSYVYTIVSRHFTHAGATRAAHRLNTQENA